MTRPVPRFYLEEWLAEHASGLALDDEDDRAELARLLLGRFALTLQPRAADMRPEGCWHPGYLTCESGAWQRRCDRCAVTAKAGVK